MNTQANQLKNEESPYLLQHANNPVAWYPWGKEALQKAKKENKLIFLSIGYSTCHWCHLMEHESFENEEIFALHYSDFQYYLLKLFCTPTYLKKFHHERRLLNQILVSRSYISVTLFENSSDTTFLLYFD
jgi:thioredoxin-related protein